jgi:hypothetical protein
VAIVAVDVAALIGEPLTLMKHGTVIVVAALPFVKNAGKN